MNTIDATFETASRDGAFNHAMKFLRCAIEVYDSAWQDACASMCGLDNTAADAVEAALHDSEQQEAFAQLLSMCD